MKILKWILIIFSVFVVLGAVVLYIFIRNFDINKYKQQITQAIAEEIDRPVTIAKLTLDFNFQKGLNIGLDNLVIREKPPAEATILSLERAFLGLDIATLLKEKKILVQQVELTRPFVHLIQREDQKTNMDSFVQPKQETKPQTQPFPKNKGSKGYDVDMSDFKIEEINVTDGHIILEKDAQEGGTVEFKDIDLLIKSFSLDRDFPVSLRVNVFSDHQNIYVQAKARLEKNYKKIYLNNVHTKISLNTFDLKQLESMAPLLKELKIEKRLMGDLIIDVDELHASEAGVDKYNGRARLSDGRVKLAALNHPIENIDILLVAQETHAEFKDIFMYVGGGEIKGRAQLEEVLSQNKFNVNLTAAAIRLEEVVPQNESEYKINGKLNGSIVLTGEHTELKPFDQSLQGSVSFHVEEGKIKNLNVLKTIIEKLSFLPNVQKGFEARLPQKYKDMIAKNDTDIDVLTFDTSVQQGELVIKRMLLQAGGFEIKSKGKIDPAQNLYLQADLFMAADLSTALLSGPEDLTFLLNESGQLHVPFKSYRGPLNKIRIYPDIENLSKQALQSKGKQELKKAIFKALDLDEPVKNPSNEPTGTTPSTDKTPQPPQQKEMRPEEILIENVLDAIFK